MNKTFFVILAAVVTLVSQSNAQLLKNYGLRIAYMSASQSFNYPNPPWPGFGPDLSRRIGIGGGVFAEWLNVPFVSIVTELDYVQRGMGQLVYITENDPTPVRSEIRKNRLDYLSVPLFVKGSVSAGILSLYVLIGPRIDFLLAYRDEFIIGKSIYEDFKKSIWGGTAGVGLEIEDMLPVSVLLEFRYDVDFVDSYDTDLLKVSNNAFAVWLGVAF
jgi:hypothetical protein